jgi:hypothetical protein
MEVIQFPSVSAIPPRAQNETLENALALCPMGSAEPHYGQIGLDAIFFVASDSCSILRLNRIRAQFQHLFETLTYIRFSEVAPIAETPGPRLGNWNLTVVRCRTQLP